MFECGFATVIEASQTQKVFENQNFLVKVYFVGRFESRAIPDFQ